MSEITYLRCPIRFSAIKLITVEAICVLDVLQSSDVPVPRLGLREVDVGGRRLVVVPPARLNGPVLGGDQVAGRYICHQLKTCGRTVTGEERVIYHG